MHLRGSPGFVGRNDALARAQGQRAGAKIDLAKRSTSLGTGQKKIG